jgi:hypothetical protein
MEDRREFIQNIIAATVVLHYDGGMTLTNAIEREKSNFVGEWMLYQSNGQSLFNIYDKNGGLSTAWMCWLIRRNVNNVEAIPIRFTMLEQMAVNFDANAIQGLVNHKIKEAIAHGIASKVSLDGGSFPMPENI